MPNNQIGPIIVKLRQHARTNDDVQLDALVDGAGVLARADTREHRAPRAPARPARTTSGHGSLRSNRRDPSRQENHHEGGNMPMCDRGRTWEGPV